MAINKLTARFCEAAGPGSYFDGEGLYLLVKKNGKRYWHMACYYRGKRKLLSLGAFPKVSLAKARQARKHTQTLLDQDIDPVEHKKSLKQAEQQAKVKKVRSEGVSFEQVTRRFMERKRGKVTEEYRTKMLNFKCGGPGILPPEAP